MAARSVSHSSAHSYNTDVSRWRGSWVHAGAHARAPRRWAWTLHVAARSVSASLGRMGFSRSFRALMPAFKKAREMTLSEALTRAFPLIIFSVTSEGDSCILRGRCRVLCSASPGRKASQRLQRLPAEVGGSLPASSLGKECRL